MRMLKRGTRRGRLRLTVAAAAVGAAMAITGFALAAQQPVVGTDAGAVNAYSQATYTMDQGEQLQFQNAGPGNQHDVWSRPNGPDGKKLFISPTINPGAATTVKGTEYLTAGTYAFFCNVHPFEMSADLTVTGNGTPIPRPRVDVTVVSGKLAKVAKKGKLAIKVEALTDAPAVTVQAKLGKAVLGTLAGLSVQAGQTKKATIKLSKSGKAKLAKKKKATVKVTGTPDFGSPDTAKRKLS